jgi:TonB family protein
MLFTSSGMTTLPLAREESARNLLAAHLPSPRLQVLWANRRQNFLENLRVVFWGPAPPKTFLGPPYFRDCWVAGPLPNRAVFFSVIWHAAFVMLLIRLWPLIPSPPRITVPQVEITYYGPINDLREILPLRPIPKRSAPHEVAQTPQPPLLAKGADAFHRRQIIVNNPLRPNHPRQTLIEPLAPAEPPRILPALPNIAVWQELAKPQLRIDPAALARLHPKGAVTRQEQVALPEAPNQENIVGAVNIAELDVNRKPALPISPMSAPKAAPQPAGRAADQFTPEPDIARASGPNDTLLIALSATPGPAMPPTIPQGNLQSRVAISPGGETRGVPTNGDRAEGSGNGPPGLIISAGVPPSTTSGVGHGSPRMPGMLAAAPVAPLAPAAGAKPAALIDTLKPGAMPEALLGGKTIYTLHINMPNLSSAMGSWVLTFAEMATSDSSPSVGPNSMTLSGPEPLRKVDPKYPPELRSRRVEGEVVLYAVIRKDGTVDSIQLVDGLDPTLDENAMNALAQWKFRPGERGGAPIDLEAIVHIPFRAVLPLY